MRTTRLYYDDAYRRAFDAVVTARQAIAGKPVVALDQTVFYPTGGGQPCDVGVLRLAGGQAVPVVDVFADDEWVWHVLDRDLEGDAVHGEIDWDRRFDHMQQHTGQHVLSQAFIVTADAETVAFHLGEKASTIDLNRTDLDTAALARAEAAANAVVDAALPVTASFVSPEELAHLPLRKPPKVTENIRIVQVAGFDWSACGGTHVAYTSHIQLIKIVGTERRGSELRVSFLCGRRGRADYARLKALAQGLVARYTASEDDMLDLLDRRAAEADALRKDVAELEKQWAESTAAALYGEATPANGVRFVAAALEVNVERAKKVAQALRTRPGVVACIGVQGERPQILATRSDDVMIDANALLRAAVAAGGGRGGGRPDWAQGGVPTNEALSAAMAAAAVAFDAAAKGS
ncbi:MAG: alanyl-tRNA editing protein [Nitrososphaerales archaeon]